MSPAHMERIEAAIRIVLEFKDAYNRHDLTVLMQCMSDDCVLETAEPAPAGTRLAGKAALAEFWQEFFRRLPDAHLEVEEIIGLGRHCILRWRSEGSEPGGQPSHLRGVDLFKVTDGLISERLSYVKAGAGT